MRNLRKYELGILLLALASVYPEVVVAEIYKWVDADGKVHFGDKPHDPETASNAEEVELRDSYQPAARNAEEQKAYDDEQHKIMLRDQMRRRKEEQAQEEAATQRREKHAELCAAYEEGLKELTTVEINSGVRHFVYIEGDDGKPVSSERQREIIEELKARMADAGCT